MTFSFPGGDIRKDIVMESLEGAQNFGDERDRWRLG